MVLAALCFTVMIAAVKVARSELSAFEIIFYRSVVSVPLAATYCWMGGTFALRAKKVMLVRTLMGFGAMVSYFVATKGLNLADLSLLTKLQPIIVAIAAPMLMGAAERAGRQVWAALALGLVGCAVLIAPQLRGGGAGFYWGIALGATLFHAGAHLAIRRLGLSESPRAVVLWFQAALLPLAAIGQLVVYRELPSIPPGHLVFWVLLCGVMATLGQWLLTSAYQKDRAAVVAAAGYAAPVWAVALDIVVFAAPPSVYVLLGGALVIAAGFLVIRNTKA